MPNTKFTRRQLLPQNTTSCNISNSHTLPICFHFRFFDDIFFVWVSFFLRCGWMSDFRGFDLINVSALLTSKQIPHHGCYYAKKERKFHFLWHKNCCHLVLTVKKKEFYLLVLFKNKSGNSKESCKIKRNGLKHLIEKRKNFGGGRINIFRKRYPKYYQLKYKND